MRELLAELDADDPEHPETSLTHESGWTLAAYQGGLLVWENVEPNTPPPRHMKESSREKILSMWLSLAKGDLAAIEREPWNPGYGPPISDEERVALNQQAEESRRQGLRDFYDSLGPERMDVSCRQTGCTRGAIPFSVFCRSHHFESIFKMPCPI
jgi:hypothetical protein